MKGPSLCYFQHYFQSGKGYVSSSGLTGKSFLTIEWTNQHGCNDRDLNCNFVLQYRCQDDTKHQTLNHHTMRNGKKVLTPIKARILSGVPKEKGGGNEARDVNRKSETCR